VQQPYQLIGMLEPAVRTELLEAVPALARTMRHTATVSALIGMGYQPSQAYQITEQWKQMGIIPRIGPETQILMSQLGPTALGTPTQPLGGGGIFGKGIQAGSAQAGWQ
jgi:hypothetical protein